ncbi:hypothetical protein GJQ69_01325 [Caproicibacterium lactatifermentans]|uniref:YoaR-like putative peptidoglycan binding domain-containing protein n=2 Tax=Caproicibacterium lactatifermentans TaxID=2666138 RepID=A0A859DNE8_9FIRM|nr:hypothetical protein GJQ69_01325 [Caproicibacterium lactatifermentans]
MEASPMYRYSEDPQSKQKNKKVVLAVVLVAAAAAAAIFILGKTTFRHTVQPTAFTSGNTSSTQPVFGSVTVEGISLKGMTMAQGRSAVLEQMEKKDAARTYTLTHGEKSYTLSGKDLHISYNTNAVLQRAMQAGTASSTTSSASSASSDTEYRLTPTVDQTSLQAKLEDLTKSVNHSAKEPTIRSFDGSGFSFTEGTPGVKVSNSALLKKVLDVIPTSDSATISIPTETVDCTRTIDDLRQHIVKLGSFTTISRNTENGTYNMSKALRAVNGTVVPANGTFSYLGTIGEAGQSQGYKLATALENGQAVQSYGGGICQGSTTIYGAAMRSNCGIVERSPHSSPSSYVPIGQDATVSFPGLDFRFSNPTDYPMYIQSGADGRTMYCTIYGYKSSTWDTIDVSSKLTRGTVETGRYATCTRTFYKNGSAVRTESMPSSYYPPHTTTQTAGSSSSSKKATSSKASSTASSTLSSKPSSASSKTASSSSSSKKPSSSSKAPR